MEIKPLQLDMTKINSMARYNITKIIQTAIRNEIQNLEDTMKLGEFVPGGVIEDEFKVWTDALYDMSRALKEYDHAIGSQEANDAKTSRYG